MQKLFLLAVVLMVFLSGCDYDLIQTNEDKSVTMYTNVDTVIVDTDNNTICWTYYMNEVSVRLNLVTDCFEFVDKDD